MASDIFAKIGDIKGESVDAKHRTRSSAVVLVGRFDSPQRHHVAERVPAGKATFQDSDDRAQHR